jgi:NAD(P)-dependent dehydrogenase (short-subunit alcohol dehydrogenase family)
MQYAQHDQRCHPAEIARCEIFPGPLSRHQLVAQARAEHHREERIGFHQEQQADEAVGCLVRGRIQPAIVKPGGKRLGETDDLKAGVVFLASPGAKFVTGQDLIIDGGWTVW